MIHAVLSRMQDRRVQRTRSAIMSAFNRLILERGYAALTPADVASAANVGRSTFYEHFSGMDGLLAETLAAVLAPLAEGCFNSHQPDSAHRAVAHIWDNRRHARRLLEGDAHAIVLRCLAAHFSTAMQSTLQRSATRPILDPDLIALQLASGHLAVLGAWLSGRSSHSARQIATALQVSGRALAESLSKQSFFEKKDQKTLIN